MSKKKEELVQEVEVQEVEVQVEQPEVVEDKYPGHKTRAFRA